MAKKRYEHKDPIIRDVHSVIRGNSYVGRKALTGGGLFVPTGVNKLMKKITDYLKIFGRGVGTGGLVAGYGIFYILFSLWRFLLTALAGLSMIWWAITLFYYHSIIWGLVVLLIGTPITIVVAGYFSIPLFFMFIVAGLVWLFSYAFGLNVSFATAWDIVWFIVKALILGALAFSIVAGLLAAIKERKILDFIKGFWGYIILFIFFLWLFL